MEMFTMLVKTKFFLDRIKDNPKNLLSYVVEYAECSMLRLEQNGDYRYLKFHSCVLGQESKNIFLHLILCCNFNLFFYCNERTSIIREAELEDVCIHPDQYAVILYACLK
jgi:hypothetical protein